MDSIPWVQPDLGLRSRATLGVRVLNPKVGSLGAQDMTPLSPKVSEGRPFLKGGVSCTRRGGQCSQRVQSAGWGRTGMCQILEGVSLNRVSPAASTQVWAPVVMVGRAMKFYYGQGV